MLELAMTVYNRREPTMRAVLSSIANFPGNSVSRILICFDGAADDTRDMTLGLCRDFGLPVRWTEIDEKHDKPRCPARAWNNVFNLVSGDRVVCISSDVILTPHSIGIAGSISNSRPDDVIIGQACHSGTGYYWQWGAAPEYKHRIMTCSYGTRPLGFNWVLPMSAVRAVGGYDEAFMGGLCYEDDDFVIRMWRHGCNFVFTDDMVGYHIEHSRKHLTVYGDVLPNEKIFISRYGNTGYLKNMEFDFLNYRFNGPLSMWAHSELSDPEIENMATILMKYNASEMA